MGFCRPDRMDQRVILRWNGIHEFELTKMMKHCPCISYADLELVQQYKSSIGYSPWILDIWQQNGTSSFFFILLTG
jgi:hypothetical protein